MYMSKKALMPGPKDAIDGIGGSLCPCNDISLSPCRDHFLPDQATKPLTLVKSASNRSCKKLWTLCPAQQHS